ncbi:MAG: glycosyltransferase [Cyanobacteria bacterium P01_F01_bin.53]
MDNLGVVAIGRNEGDRLIRCLTSLQKHLTTAVPIVYVDSGSTDGSVAAAEERGVHVIQLDMSVPFTGARARNAGFDHLMEKFPNTQYVQFIDGDCELLPGWIEAAIGTLEASPELAIVFGRLRERFPEASPYNQMADLEWQVPVGEADACGGISLMRSQPIQAAGGFNPAMICGEEPELCIRLRQAGWKLECIDADMALHDIDMHQFGQWWKRSIRGGWAVGEGFAMYGDTPEQYMKRENFSGWLWGAVVPLLAISLAPFTKGITLLLFLSYLPLAWKIYQYRSQQRGDGAKQAAIYAIFCVISKMPQVIGQVQYWLSRSRKEPATLIEYKGQS